MAEYPKAVFKANLKKNFMKMTVSISRGGQALYTGEYEISVEGDLERAVSNAIAEARARIGPGVLWDFVIHVDKV
jgi:hypothetical protein